jgi:hypothetical protein
MVIVIATMALLVLAVVVAPLTRQLKRNVLVQGKFSGWVGPRGFQNFLLGIRWADVGLPSWNVLVDIIKRTATFLLI